VEGVPNAASVGDYARIVHDKAVLRNIMVACQGVVHHILQTNENVEEVRAEAEKVLFSALAKMERVKLRSMAQILQDVFQRIQDVHDRKSRLLGLPTGYYELDDMTSGLQAGQLYIVAGRPSMGKTSFALNIAENIALREQKSVLIFSLEMSADQVAQSMLCSHARVDSSLLRSGRVSEEEFQKLVMAAGAFHEAKIMIDDSGDLSALEMRTRARRMKATEDIGLVVVDYLQKMNAKQNGRYQENRQVEISTISSSLKSMAKELGVPVVALAQINRGPEGRDDRRPMLSDLRESGAIEQDADVVMTLFREEYYKPDSEKKGVAEVNVAKNRTGPTGIVELAFLKKFTRFENLAAASPSY
jgi:replicative DNA helicase